MTDQLNPANNIAEAILSELDHFQQHFHPAGGALTGPGQYHLLNEPCVGYAAAQRPNGSKVEIFICRNYVPFDYKPARHSIDYASYLSKAGRIMAKKPGEVHAFAVTDRLGFTLEQYAFELTAKDEFRPRKDGSHWDATDRDIAETLDKIADITPSAIYNYVGRWQRAASGLTTEEIDTAVFPNIPPLIAKLKKEVKDLVEGLSLARLFLLIPRAYHEFREVPANQTRFFEWTAKKRFETASYQSRSRMSSFTRPWSSLARCAANCRVTRLACPTNSVRSSPGSASSSPLTKRRISHHWSSPAWSGSHSRRVVSPSPVTSCSESPKPASATGQT